MCLDERCAVTSLKLDVYIFKEAQSRIIFSDSIYFWFCLFYFCLLVFLMTE